MAFPWRPVALTPFAAACQSGGSRLSGAGGLVSSPMSIRGRPEGDPREIRGKSEGNPSPQLLTMWRSDPGAFHFVEGSQLCCNRPSLGKSEGNRPGSLASASHASTPAKPSGSGCREQWCGCCCPAAARFATPNRSRGHGIDHEPCTEQQVVLGRSEWRTGLQ